MAKAGFINEPQLPWADHGEDRGFRALVIVLLVLFMAAGIVMNLVKLPEVEQKNLVDVSPRLAKLILEKQKIKPPPPPKPEPKPEEKKKEVEKKKEEPKKEVKKPEPKKKEEPKKSAREVAQSSGLIALSDELEDLRESFDLDEVIDQPQQTAGKEAVKVATASDLLTSSATQSSGGIKTDTLNRNLKTSELAQRKTTRVESKIESDSKQLAKVSTGGTGTGSGSSRVRSSDEIERVFQQNKGGIFTLYNRALRKNPSLAGKVVVELRIGADGSVLAAKILSSELGDEALERKLLLKIKKFKFKSSNVAEITVTYPIDFLPS